MRNVTFQFIRIYNYSKYVLNRLIAKIPIISPNSRIRMALRTGLYKKLALSIISEHIGLMRWVTFDTTENCNAKCVFCNYRLKPLNDRKTMSLESFNHYLGEVVKIGVKSVDLTPSSGEPMVDRYFFERLEALNKSKIEKIRFYTNGIALNPENTEKLVSFKNKFNGTLEVLITIGGFDSKTYQEIHGVDKFESTMQNTFNIIESNREKNSLINIFIRPKCSRDKIRGIYYDKLRNYAINGLVGIKVSTDDKYEIRGTDIVKNNAQGDFKFRQISGRRYGPCDVVFSNGIRINVDGTVQICSCTYRYDSLIIGDLNKEPISVVLENRKDVITDMLNNNFPETCNRCSFYASIFSHGSYFSRKIKKDFKIRRPLI